MRTINLEELSRGERQAREHGKRRERAGVIQVGERRERKERQSCREKTNDLHRQDKEKWKREKNEEEG